MYNNIEINPFATVLRTIEQDSQNEEAHVELTQARLEELTEAAKILAQSDPPLLRKAVIHLQERGESQELDIIQRIYEEYIVPLPSIAYFRILPFLSDSKAFACVNHWHAEQVAKAKENPIAWEINDQKKSLLKIKIDRSWTVEQLVSHLSKTAVSTKIQHLDLRGLEDNIDDTQLETLLSICNPQVNLFFHIANRDQEMVNEKISYFARKNCQLHLTLTSCDIEKIEGRCILSLHISNCSRLTSIQNLHPACISIQIEKCENLQELSAIQSNRLHVDNCPRLHTLKNIEAKEIHVYRNPNLRTIDATGVNHLIIDSCTSLSQFPNPLVDLSIRRCEGGAFMDLSNLRSQAISIRGCNQLQTITNISAEKICLSHNSALQRIETSSATTHLVIEHCPSLTALPPLPQARYIEIRNTGVQKIEGPFPELETLKAEECHSLGEVTGIDPEKIQIENCARLNPHTNTFTFDGSGEEEITIPAYISYIESINNVKKVVITGHSHLQTIGTITNVEEVEIRQSNLLEFIDTLSQIGKVTISNCFTLHSIQSLSQVKDIQIDSCRSLTQLPFSFTGSGEDEIVIPAHISHIESINNVKKVIITGRSNVKTIGTITNVEEVEIRQSNLLESIDHLSQISKVTISHCSRLGSIQSLSQVKDLLIHSCNALQRVSVPFFTKTQFSDCPQLKRIGYLPLWLWKGVNKILLFFYRLFHWDSPQQATESRETV